MDTVTIPTPLLGALVGMAAGPFLWALTGWLKDAWLEHRSRRDMARVWAKFERDIEAQHAIDRARGTYRTLDESRRAYEATWGKR